MDEQDPGSPRGALIALLVVAVLLAGSAWLYHRLHAAASVQDCVMSGRRDCAPLR